MTIPSPGSDEAIKLGCKCPVLDNAHGRGAYFIGGEALFWYSPNCLIHNVKNDKTNYPG